MTHEDGLLGWSAVRDCPAGSGLSSLLESRAPRELDDAELVDALAAEQRLVNLHEGRALALMAELDARRAAEGERDCRDGRDVTARSQTVTEVAAATRQSKGRVERLLHTAHLLRTRLGATRALLAQGRIGGYQCQVIADQVLKLVDHDATGAVEAHILRGVCGDVYPECETTLAPATAAQVRRIAIRAVAEAEPAAHERRHDQAFRGRGVDTCIDDEDGMGMLRLHHTSLTIQSIYDRFGRIAREQCDTDDPRTLDQRAADLMAAVLCGETAAPVDSGGARVPVARGAQIHVTMTLGALAGVSDQPARLLGGGVIPASLARQVAYRTDSTWYRLLTDDSGRMVELSSNGYRPGAPLSRSVLAEHQTCVQVGCQRPASRCEYDHEQPWPSGRTTQTNLSPKCPVHHRGKTAGRFASNKSRDGTVEWTYPTGHTYSVAPPTHPVDDMSDASAWVEPESVAQIQEGLRALVRERARRSQHRVDDAKRQAREAMLRRWYAEEPCADLAPVADLTANPGLAPDTDFTPDTAPAPGEVLVPAIC